MKYGIKLVKKTIVVLLIFLVVLLRGFSLYESQISLSDDRLQARGTTYTDRVEIGYHDWNDRTLHYIDMGDITKPMVVLIHGAPGSISDWKELVSDSTMFDAFRFVIVDRLGYGRSEQGKSVTDFTQQSQSIFSVISSLPNESGIKPIVMGHSYGATIAVKMLMDGTDKLAGGIIVSGAVDPENEIVFWISHVVKWPILKQLMGPMLRVANDEKLSHVVEIETNLQDFDRITVPMRIVHGDADTIVPFANAEYLFDRVDAELVSMSVYEGVDHPMQYNNYLDLRKELKAFYESL